MLGFKQDWQASLRSVETKGIDEMHIFRVSIMTREGEQWSADRTNGIDMGIHGNAKYLKATTIRHEGVMLHGAVKL